VIAAVFDVDRTLLPGTGTERQFMLWLLRRGVIGPREVIRALVDVGRRYPELRKRGYFEYHGYLAGGRETDVRDWAKACFHQRILPRLSKAGEACVREHREAGHQTFLLSGSIMPLVRLLGDYLAVDCVVATELEVEAGFYTGRLSGKHVAAEQKAYLVGKLSRQYGFDLSQAYCYADHRSDLAMLEQFGNPRPTNPDRILLRVAEERGWKIESFR
jgi:HAD superfamily hydrolase (TIGR01490 family)